MRFNERMNLKTSFKLEIKFVRYKPNGEVLDGL